MDKRFYYSSRELGIVFEAVEIYNNQYTVTISKIDGISGDVIDRVTFEGLPLTYLLNEFVDKMKEAKVPGDVINTFFCLFEKEEEEFGDEIMGRINE